jgi:hypothetical protein
MIYLPMTTVAVRTPTLAKRRAIIDSYQQTIFAMPVFQFANDWRNWRLQPVYNASSSSSGGGTNNTPVFSGYFWIYFAISGSLTLITIEVWWRFTSREIERRKGKHWSRSLAEKMYKHVG